MHRILCCTNPSCGKQSEGQALRADGPCPHCRTGILRPREAATTPTVSEAGPEKATLEVAPAARPPSSSSTRPASGTGTSSSVSSTRLPEQIGRFRIRALLGRGAFGVVYRAYDPQNDLEVALKVPLPGTLDDPQRRERFLREARTIAQLQHPNIVPLVEAGGKGSELYLASVLIQGSTLAEAISRRRLALPDRVRVARELAEALHYAHSVGIVHRDVKPANVLLDEVDRPHLLDFGLAHCEDAKTLTQAGAIIGTPAYMAPEIVADSAGKDRPTADQYSLGVLLYELLTGRAPFEGPRDLLLYKAIHEQPQPPSSLDKSVPAELDVVCLKALAKRPQDRYADCQALAEDLLLWEIGLPISSRSVSSVDRAMRWCGQALDWSKRPSRTSTSESKTSTTPAKSPHKLVPQSLPAFVGRFQVRSMLGRGAFGVVYRAYDPDAEREVALKVPLPGVLNDPDRRERFLREAHIVAQLKHPHIVPLLETGGEGAELYLASVLITGQSLSRAIGKRSLSLLDRVRVVEELADGLAYAHERGIVHRDVKPENVLLDDKKTAYLLDFGLARHQFAQTLTQTGALLGTPAYMAPELVRAVSNSGRAAADQYALGVLFYEVLTGRVPFEGPSAAVLYKALHEQPQRPSRLVEGMPRELEMICLKALAKKPEDRYTSCRALAEDLHRWRAGIPISLRPPGPVSRARSWCGQHKAGLTAALVVLLMIPISFLAWRTPERPQAQAQVKPGGELEPSPQVRSLSKPDPAEPPSTEKSPVVIASTLPARASKPPGSIVPENLNVGLFAEYYEGPFFDRVLQPQVGVHPEVVVGREPVFCPTEFFSVRWTGYLKSPGPMKGRLILRADDGVRVWLDERPVIDAWYHQSASLHSAAVELSGQPQPIRIEYCQFDGSRMLSVQWEPEKGKAELVPLDWFRHDASVTTAKPPGPTRHLAAFFQAHSGAIARVAFLREGNHLVSAGRDGFVRFWDRQSFRFERRLPLRHPGLACVDISADERRVVTVGSDGMIRFWDLETSLRLGDYQAPGGALKCCFVGSGHQVLSAGKEGVRRWDTMTPTEEGPLLVAGEVRHLATTADGQLMAFATAKPGWSLNLWKHGSSGWKDSVVPDFSVTSIATTPDGSKVIWGDYRSIKVRASEPGGKEIDLKGSLAWTSSMAVSADGKRLLTAEWDTSVRYWDLESGRELKRYLGCRVPVQSVALSADGRLAACGCRDGTIRVWALPAANDIGGEVTEVFETRAPEPKTTLVPKGTTAKLAQTLPMKETASAAPGNPVIKLGPLQGVAVLHQSGKPVMVRCELRNVSDKYLKVPIVEGKSSLGILHAWIERRDGNQLIPLPKALRDGNKYPAGFDSVFANPVLQPNEVIPLHRALDTKGFPRGQYRYHLEYRPSAADVSHETQVQAIDFNMR